MQDSSDGKVTGVQLWHNKKTSYFLRSEKTYGIILLGN